MSSRLPMAFPPRREPHPNICSMMLRRGMPSFRCDVLNRSVVIVDEQKNNDKPALLVIFDNH